MNETDIYIERIVSTYSRMLLRIAYTVLHSTADAEDAVQDVFIKLITKRPHHTDEEHEKAWLIRVTINTSLNMRKRLERESEPVDENVGKPDEALTDSELLEVVLSLPPKYGTVTHLYYYEGYSIKEIAAILLLPSATVGTRLARAREILKNTLKGEN